MSLTFQLLVVAGGGSGGYYDGVNYGNGGGAGGLIYNASYSYSYGQVVAVTVGTGGNGAPGNNSVFNDQTAIGGGRGSRGGAAPATSGGSGGGGGGAGTAGQGNAGNGGGGGGAGFASTGRNGGDGLAYSISGSSVYYAGGGGGSTASFTPGGSGGQGGGGQGGSATGSCSAGTDGLGGGGGGGSSAGGPINGGSGVVIISYPTTTNDGTGGTITYVGGNTIHTFTTSGTFTAPGLPYFIETLSVSDSVSLVHNHLKSLQDAAVLEDALSFVTNRIRQDYFFGTDKVSKALSRKFVDGFSISDSIATFWEELPPTVNLLSEINNQVSLTSEFV